MPPAILKMGFCRQTGRPNLSERRIYITMDRAEAYKCVAGHRSLYGSGSTHTSSPTLSCVIISWIRYYYFASSFAISWLQVIVGGGRVFAAVVLIGNPPQPPHSARGLCSTTPVRDQRDGHVQQGSECSPAHRYCCRG